MSSSLLSGISSVPFLHVYIRVANPTGMRLFFDWLTRFTCLDVFLPAHRYFLHDFLCYEANLLSPCAFISSFILALHFGE